ncbi:hypothetical protein [Arenivirga flava]|uniref:Uncharacterized protein n=1 Tax=Arenivirga flava TaxID=1930060 RepID=A0AA37UUR5_9MICO|nr:hypothetical protein [Arenivirga flava]GMA28897.1 hypothetical protein GCM10025874_21500 [Arenivirga flava]
MRDVTVETRREVGQPLSFIDFSDADGLLPDFLDLGAPIVDADFAVTASTSDADGGVLVFPDAVLVIDGDRQDRLLLSEVTRWSITDAADLFLVEVQVGSNAFTARLPRAFRAPTVGALRAALGTPEKPA